MIFLENITEHLPFLAATTGKFNGIRILEAVIIAVIVTLGTSYITVREMKIEYNHLKTQVTELVKTVDALHPRK